MEHKTVDLLETKADDSGSFVALASVFGNVDSVGDRMMPGAFSKTLEQKRDAGKPIPVVFSHGWEDPFNYIGKADPHKVVETEKGLEVHGRLDLSNPTAKQVHSLMRDGTITGWSFGYTVPDGGQERKNGANEVSEVDLIEVGPTLRGANSEAQLQAVKALETIPDEDKVMRPAQGLIPAVELEGAETGELKAVWTAAFINDLPDSAFLYIAPGGEKNGGGKTVPRSLRYFPYKGSDGTIDLPHLRNAVARIPQANLPEDVKNRVQARARRLLENTNSSASLPAEEPEKANPGQQDALAQATEEWWLDVYGS